MNFLNVLKKCESNVSQIARDTGLKRQSIYGWGNGAFPREDVFKSLLAMDKYSEELSKINYDELRGENKLGRPIGTTKKKPL